PLVLRLGIAAVFMWFGVSELLNPAQWVGFIPGWATASFGLSAGILVVLNGLFEIVAAILLALNVLSRWVALLLSLHLFIIVGEVGLGPIGVRDFGLAIMALAFAMLDEEKENESLGEIQENR
ncbi:MAG: DoxX family membrane protein, partial [Minisyncoccia bacterium]